MMYHDDLAWKNDEPREAGSEYVPGRLNLALYSDIPEGRGVLEKMDRLTEMFGDILELRAFLGPDAEPFTEGAGMQDRIVGLPDAEDREAEDDEILYEEYFSQIGEARELVLDIVRTLCDVAGSHGFSGNIWQDYIALVLAEDENAFSLACEMRGRSGGGADAMARLDFGYLKRIFDLDLIEAAGELNMESLRLVAEYPPGQGKSKVYNVRIRDSIQALAQDLARTDSAEGWLDRVAGFYKQYGVGMFGLHKAFRIEGEGDSFRIVPITKTEHVSLDSLVGYESQKKRLTDNTEAFVTGRLANNCLLYGDSGTGKSSSIKAIINGYYPQGLRMIEIYKHQFRDLSKVISRIKNRNYRFIIYMDDLSFEDFEIEYKYLKAIIEGGLERRPDNVLIYATSNRRHLIREQYGDKEEIREDMHTSDTVQEKMSLVARFGVTIYYGRPGKTEFQDIVTQLAQRAGVTMPEEQLLLEANKWELSHGGMSGRTAVQFITYLKGMQDMGR